MLSCIGWWSVIVTLHQLIQQAFCNYVWYAFAINWERQVLTDVVQMSVCLWMY